MIAIEVKIDTNLVSNWMRFVSIPASPDSPNLTSVSEVIHSYYNYLMQIINNIRMFKIIINYLLSWSWGLLLGFPEV